MLSSTSRGVAGEEFANLRKKHGLAIHRFDLCITAFFQGWSDKLLNVDDSCDLDFKGGLDIADLVECNSLTEAVERACKKQRV